jgi:hypothetical protein
MYRLTLDREQSDAWIAKHVPSFPASQSRRIYRWGDMWGILTKDVWSVEKRHFVQANPLIERIESVNTLHAPPITVDDVWDEEFITIQDTEYTGLVSVCLPGPIMNQWCTKHAIEVPTLHSPLDSIPCLTPTLIPTPNHTNHTNNSNKSAKPFVKQRDRVCLISDD